MLPSHGCFLPSDCIYISDPLCLCKAARLRCRPAALWVFGFSLSPQTCVISPLLPGQRVTVHPGLLLHRSLTCPGNRTDCSPRCSIAGFWHCPVIPPLLAAAVTCWSPRHRAQDMDALVRWLPWSGCSCHLVPYVCSSLCSRPPDRWGTNHQCQCLESGRWGH